MKTHTVIKQTCIDFLPKIRRRHRKGDIVACTECGTLFRAVAELVYAGFGESEIVWSWKEVQ